MARKKEESCASLQSVCAHPCVRGDCPGKSYKAFGVVNLAPRHLPYVVASENIQAIISAAFHVLCVVYFVAKALDAAQAAAGGAL